MKTKSALARAEEANTLSCHEADPLISIVTVVLNGERLLLRTITSAMTQTYKNTEMIIIDGGSTDSTIDIIKSCQHFVTGYISEPDRGIYDAMNKALSMCRGDYLYFLNCGDYFTDKDVLREVAHHLRDGTVDIFCGGVLEDSSTGTRRVGLRPASEYQLFHDTICQQALFTSRRIFDLVGPFDERYKICADRDWLLRAVRRFQVNIQYCDLPICYFDSSGVSSRQRIRLRLENMLINYRHFGTRFYPLLLQQMHRKLTQTFFPIRQKNAER